MIFITGATGGVGTELCRLLTEANIPARAMYRRPEQSVQFTRSGLDAVKADFDDVESLRSGMAGCDRLFLLTHADEDHFSREKSIIEVAIDSGITQIVKISTADTNLSSNLSYAKSHAEIDHYLRSMPVSWTILRPTGFMQNFLESARLIRQGILPHMMRSGQIGYIDLRDLAAVAKAVLTEDGHNKATYYLTGPQSLTVKQISHELTAALGFVVQEIHTSSSEMRNALASAGLSEWNINALLDQFEIGANGGEIDVTEEVERLTGKPPGTFSQFINDYKNHFIRQ
jgi:uncharacterized protein YbjT (DUF2867 family)